MKKAEDKGEEGEVDEAQELFQEAEELQQQKAGLEAKVLQVRRGQAAMLLARVVVRRVFVSFAKFSSVGQVQ